MNLLLILLSVFTVLLLAVLVAVLRDPSRADRAEVDAGSSEESSRQHVIYFPQMRQAMSAEDFAFVAARGSNRLASRIRRERRRVALVYLSYLHRDFLKLWRLARVIAAMSPQVGLSQEIARLRLGLLFSLRYQMVRVKFYLGFSPLPELGSLSEAVSRLAMRLDTAMRDLGERAALAAKLASSLDGRNLNTP